MLAWEGHVYIGLEVDMINVGDADCILVSSWNGLEVTRVLIDGGNASDFDVVRRFLRKRGISHLDAIVASHMHNDHVAGLLALAADRSVTIGHAFLHRPQDHVRMSFVKSALKTTCRDSAEAQCFDKTLQASSDLAAALDARRIPISEPFQGTRIGPLLVVGPSLSYYEELVQKFEDVDAIRAIDQGNLDHELENAIDEALVNKGILGEVGLLENPETTPENNSSVILATVYNGRKYLFTSDAGVPALKLATDAYKLSGCHWMQIPHHGSRRNISAELIEHFSPKSAFVSASGSAKHPRRAVVNAFKKVGAKVYSTHYPKPESLWKHDGTVPARGGYTSATPLYEKDEKADAPNPVTLDALSKFLAGTGR
jgi:beta-lactamase superfamily II metal-dependent hydrolase